MLAAGALLISLSILTIHGQDLSVDDTSHSDCYEGNGQTYRGVTNMTEQGAKCLVWDSVVRQGQGQEWSHLNHCRNPDGDDKPWCLITKENKLAWDYCKVKKCPGAPATPPPPVSPQPGPSPFSQCGKKHGTLFTAFKQNPGGHPWHGSVQMRPKGSSSEFRHTCGGALLSSCWVVTAASCVQPTHEYQVVLGVNIGEHEVQTVPVIQTIVHANYSTTEFSNDIALLQLQVTDSPYCAKETRFVKSVCLPDQNFPAGTQCGIAIWGIANTRRLSSQPFIAIVELVPEEQCKAPEVYGGLLDNSMLCAGNLDTCQASGGSPLVCSHDDIHYVTGLLSWSDNCGKKKKPQVYANVYLFVDWIRSKINSTSVN